MVAGQVARLQLAGPIPPLAQRQIRIVGKMALDPQLVKLLIIQGAELPRQPPAASG